MLEEITGGLSGLFKHVLPDPYWARNRIAKLDARRDAREIAHLSLEVVNGEPIFTHAMFVLASARQVAVPSIARTVYRGGRGAVMQNVTKRNNDTLLFFGHFLRYGTDAEGMKAIDRLNKIHSAFDISNDENLYTLATLACEPRRFGLRFTGREVFSAREVEAHYWFWRDVGEKMGIQGIPADPDLFMNWYNTFEQNNYGYTDDGHLVTEQHARDFASRWFKGPLHELGRQVYFSLFDPHLRETLGFTVDVHGLETTVQNAIRAFLAVMKVKPDHGERHLSDDFSSEYGASYSFDKAGVDVDVKKLSRKST